MRLTFFVLVLAVTGVPPGTPVSGSGEWNRARAAAPAADARIPPSVQAEHNAIHAALVESTRLPGRVGEAARALAAVLHPHFLREEEIALVPLGLLAPLAAGRAVTGADDILAMTDALKRELPRMLEEHAKIRDAVQTLRRAAAAEGAAAQVSLAETLAHHAQTEEEVLYPAAILVGDMLRARR